MSVDAASARGRLGHDHPARGRGGRPTAFGSDLRSEATLSIDRSHEVVDVDDVGLQLDDESRARRCVPGQEVDHSPFPVDRERQLGHDGPTPDAAKVTGELLVQASVACIEQSVEITATPSRDDVDADLKRGGVRPDGTQRVVVEVPTLDPRDHRSMDADRLGQILLTPTSTMADRP